VEEAKTNPEVRKDMMMQEAKDYYFYKKGVKQGLETHRDEVREEYREEAIDWMVRVLKRTKLSDIEIILELSKEYPDHSDLIKKCVATND